MEHWFQIPIEQEHDRIFIKSFSDCFYLESNSLIGLLLSCNRIFNGVFGFYTTFENNEEYTPLLRCGVVKDWTIRFKDLASFANNNQATNPVGLGVARAYWTSEKSKLSGMRIIVSKEIITEIEITPFSRNGYSCFYRDYLYHNLPCRFYFDTIQNNEDNESVELYELIWTEEVMSSCTYEYVEQLKKIRSNFTGDAVRHFKKTSEIVLKGLLISDCAHRTASVFHKFQDELNKLAT